jgi:hypothetical protein
MECLPLLFRIFRSKGVMLLNLEPGVNPPRSGPGISECRNEGRTDTVAAIVERFVFPLYRQYRVHASLVTYRERGFFLTILRVPSHLWVFNWDSYHVIFVLLNIRNDNTSSRALTST